MRRYLQGTIARRLGARTGTDESAASTDGPRCMISLSITHITAVVVPVAGQEEALAFDVERLGLEKVLDFTYGSGAVA